LDDDSLMRLVAGGDAAAFGMLVRAYQNRLVRFAARLLNDSELAQDAAQEAFLRLWRGRAAYQPCGCLQAYLFRTVRSVCSDCARRSHPAETLAGTLEASGPDPAFFAEAKSLTDAVQAAVHRLPEPQRIVFLLSHYEQLSYAEIADVLDCPVGTVASRKHQAVETLRRKLFSWKDPN